MTRSPPLAAARLFDELAATRPFDELAAARPFDELAAARLFDEIGGTLRLAGVLAAARRPVELAGLEDAVGRLCAACLDLPPALGRAQRPRLLALLAELEALAAAGGGVAR